MTKLGMSEVLRVDTMKSLCCMLNRNFERKGYGNRIRDIKYGSGKFHYIETIKGNIIYSFSDKDPRDIMKEIIERANALIF